MFDKVISHKAQQISICDQDIALIVNEVHVDTVIPDTFVLLHSGDIISHNCISNSQCLALYVFKQISIF